MNICKILIGLVISTCSWLQADSQIPEPLSGTRPALTKFTNDTIFIRDSIHLPKALFLLNFHFSSLPNEYVLHHSSRIPVYLHKTNDAKELFQKIAEDGKLPVGQKLPPFKLSSLNGIEEYFDDIRPRTDILLIDFWASWCLPCRDNMPELKAIYYQLSGKSFAVFSISLDKDTAKWKSAIQEEGLSMWMHGQQIGAYKMGDILGIHAIPLYILIDAQGKVLGKFNGRWKGLEDLKAAISKHVNTQVE